MLSEEDFQKNLDFFSKTNPQAAVAISLTDSSGLEFIKSESGDWNLKTIINEKNSFLHSRQDPIAEAKDWFDQLHLQNEEVVYVFGVGLGYYYEAIKPWLKKNKQRQLVFLEDNFGVIHRLLETKIGTRILQDPQVHLHYFHGLGKEESRLEWLFWSFIQKPFRVTALKSYAHDRKLFYEHLHQKILYEASNKNAMVDEYLKFGIAFFRNFYPNVLQLYRSYLGNSLFGKFPQMPAIICGAGPSLKKNIAVLRTLQDRALIFAGGSAINALTSHHILPHFGAGIDPNPAQYTRFSTNNAFEVPFFYRNRLHHQAFEAIHGPRLYITGAGGYGVAEWFERELGIAGIDVDEGHNVVNFCAEIAKEIGCNPIIFVGMDLAYTNKQMYASGVIQKRNVNTKTLIENDQAIRWKDIRGKPIYTLWKWVAESEWISNFAKKNPNLILINATEGGIGFTDVPNITLKQVAASHLKTAFDLKGKIHGEIQNAVLFDVTEGRVRDLLIKLKESLKTSLKLLEILKEECLAVKKIIKDGKEPPLGLHTGRSALAESDLLEEPAFPAILEIFNEVYQNVYNREMQELSTPHSHLTTSKRNLKLLDINAKRYEFLKHTVQANLFLIDGMLLDKRGEK